MIQIDVVVIEANRLFREGLRQVLCKPPFMVTAAVANAGELSSIAGEAFPNVVVWGSRACRDIEEQMASVRKHCSGPQQMHFVFLTEKIEAGWVRRVAAAGADAVLSHDISSEVLHRALDLVMLGQQLFPASLFFAPAENAVTPLADLIPFPTSAEARAAIIKLEQNRSVVLSEREGQILRCLANGATNKAIARELHVTETTVKAHVKGVLRKVRATNRTQAAIWALDNNFRGLGSVDRATHHSSPGAPDRRTAS